ncbi:MAG TPA: FixH family protein [Azospirillaceae bacterium]|nr:FixH family protein [Azospirillaceae bacterium]
MTVQTMHPPAPRRSLIPWLFVAGLGLVFLVNMGLVYFSVSSFPGIAVPKAYERGRHYNEALAAQARQDGLGWGVDAVLGADGTLVVTVQSMGRPLDGLEVRGELERPLEQLAVVPAAFRAEGEGRYAAAIDLPKAGLWELRARLVRGNDTYLLVKRLVVR